MTCGCEATINETDPRAPIWMYVFGKHSFPLRHPLPKNMGNLVGVGYEGDAEALTPEQKERLTRAMMEKFHISAEEVEKTLKEGILPIRAEGVIVSWCSLHVRMTI